MSTLNIEIKARCSDSEFIRDILIRNKADFIGTDHQIDTYFKARNGRYKMREGNIEYSLVYYDRENIAGPKRSEVIYYHPRKTDPVKQQLSRALGELIVVDKKRDIYFIDNIKFHLDEVQELGSFVEIEAIDRTGEIGSEKLYEQCRKYLKFFRISEADLITNSYSDMLLEQMFTIRKGTIDEAYEIAVKIPEFQKPYSREKINRRLQGKSHLILIADHFDQPAGFKIGYEIEGGFYSWLGGVLPDFRNKGIADKLAGEQEKWCRSKGLKFLRIKTRNKFKPMLQLLLKRNFNFVNFTAADAVEDSWIILEKEL